MNLRRHIGLRRDGGGEPLWWWHDFCADAEGAQIRLMNLRIPIFHPIWVKVKVQRGEWWLLVKVSLPWRIGCEIILVDVVGCFDLFGIREKSQKRSSQRFSYQITYLIKIAANVRRKRLHILAVCRTAAIVLTRLVYRHTSEGLLHWVNFTISTINTTVGFVAAKLVQLSVLVNQQPWQCR